MVPRTWSIGDWVVALVGWPLVLAMAAGCVGLVVVFRTLDLLAGCAERGVVLALRFLAFVETLKFPRGKAA